MKMRFMMYIRKNFRNMKKIKHLLPKPIWDGHETELECYDFAWKTAFKNIKNPSKESGFVSPFIDTAFN